MRLLCQSVLAVGFGVMISEITSVSAAPINIQPEALNAIPKIHWEQRGPLWLNPDADEDSDASTSNHNYQEAFNRLREKRLGQDQRRSAVYPSPLGKENGWRFDLRYSMDPEFSGLKSNDGRHKGKRMQFLH